MGAEAAEALRKTREAYLEQLGRLKPPFQTPQPPTSPFLTGPAWGPVCMPVIPADPSIDPGIWHPVPAYPKFTMRIVHPPACVR